MDTISPAHPSFGPNVKLFEVESPQDFDAALEKAKQFKLPGDEEQYQQKPQERCVLVHFYGALAPEGHPLFGTGRSWCEDCEAADPVLAKHIARLPASTAVVILRCPVLRQEYKGNENYVFRKHPKVRLKSIPTLIHWGKTNAKERLEEAQCADDGLVSDLIDELIAEYE